MVRLYKIPTIYKNKIFNVGDKVKYTSNRFGDGWGNPLWGGSKGYQIGTISEILVDFELSDEPSRFNPSETFVYEVCWYEDENAHHNSYTIGDLELAVKPVLMEDSLFEI